MNHQNNFLAKLKTGDFRILAKCISLVENELSGSEDLLKSFKYSNKAHIIGITGPPGAGKSTLVNALLKSLVHNDKKVAVVSVDPSSPFNFGALLGDRIRMSDFYLNPNVYIRSVASRGSLGGLSSKIIEILDVIRQAPFDYIIVETVGVGQSEVEIAGIADTTIVVSVPEAGDEVQTMKAGIMEIADIFVVNKGDRPHADIFIKNLKALAHGKASDWEIPVIKCISTEFIGIDELIIQIEKHKATLKSNTTKQLQLLAEKAYHLIQNKRMKDIDKLELQKLIWEEMNKNEFNIYNFISHY